MPQSYPIDVILYDGIGAVLPGVNVSLQNSSNGEVLATSKQKTTNENGNAIVNAGDLVSGFTDGDGYELILTKKSYQELRINGTIDEAGGPRSHVLNLQLTTAGLEIQSILSSSILSRALKTFQVWANDKASSGTAFVITSGGAGQGNGHTKADFPGINLLPNQVAYITQLTHFVRTASKVNYVEVVKCADRDGAGTAVAISPQIYQANGGTVDNVTQILKFVEPIRIPYNSDSAESIGLKVKGTDSSTKIDVAMEGYILEE